MYLRKFLDNSKDKCLCGDMIILKPPIGSSHVTFETSNGDLEMTGAESPCPYTSWNLGFPLCDHKYVDTGFPVLYTAFEK